MQHTSETGGGRCNCLVRWRGMNQRESHTFLYEENLGRKIGCRPPFLHQSKSLLFRFHALVRSSHAYGLAMARLWPGYGLAMVQLRSSYAQLWHSYGPGGPAVVH